MLNPNFDPLAELEQHALMLHQHERTIMRLQNKITKQDELITDLANANQDIVELVINLQNNIKFIREQLDASH